MRQPIRAIDTALQEVAESVGANLAFDAHRIVTFECANGVLCSIEAPDQEEHVFLHAPVLRALGDGRGAMLQKALTLNMFRLNPPGAALAYDAESAELVLCFAMPATDLDGERLAGVLAVFVEQAGALRADLSASASGDSLEDLSSFIRA
jgi:hypothetical protein